MLCFADLVEDLHQLVHMRPTYRNSTHHLNLRLEMEQLRPYRCKGECLKLVPVQCQLLSCLQILPCPGKHTREIKYSIWSKNQWFSLSLSNKKSQNQNPYLLIL